MKPLLTPKFSCRIVTSGAAQLVVHEALETTKSLSGSKAESFTPSTKVLSGSVAGAEITARLAPASRCADAFSFDVNSPVDSMTISAPSSPQGSSAGFRTASTLILSLPTTMASPSTETSSSRTPWTLSYLRRCASVSASVMSLTATTSTSPPCSSSAL